MVTYRVDGNDIREGQIYRHFKHSPTNHHIYIVTGFRADADDLEIRVDYENAETREKWSRKLKNWFDIVERDNYVGPRFTLMIT